MKLAVHRVVHHPMREVPSERLGVPNPIAIMAPAPAQMRVAQIAPKERTFIFKSFEWFRICYLNYLGARNQDSDWDNFHCDFGGDVGDIGCVAGIHGIFYFSDEFPGL